MDEKPTCAHAFPFEYDNTPLSHGETHVIPPTDKGRRKGQSKMHKENETVARTPNLLCTACKLKKRHTPREFELYHPRAGEGFHVEFGQKPLSAKKHE